MNKTDLLRLAMIAWNVREHAHIIGPTRVGCAILGSDNAIYSGCNVEHRFRSHDVHAEVNAITSMVSSGCPTFTAMFIAAERDRFTPCGACMDWIMQFASGDDIEIVAQSKREGPLQRFIARQLMPYYPH